MKAFSTKSTIRNHARFAKPAGEVMTRHPLSVNETATIRDAAAFLTARSISAAPVINEAGRPVGVLSLADVVRHAQGDESSQRPRLNAPVSKIMTDAVFFVRPDTPVGSVIDDLLASDVKRLFVVDENEVLVGVISTRDLLRYLHLDAPNPPRASPRRAPYRRRVPALAKRPAPFSKTPRTGSDIVLAGLYG